MYDILVLGIIAIIPAALALGLMVRWSIIHRSINPEISIFQNILIISSVILMIMILGMSWFFKTSEDIGSTKQAVALNSSHKPMYDMINTQDDWDNSSVKYKVYLKSGKTKTVSPKVVYVNHSKESYLKTQRNQYMTKLFGLKFKNHTTTDYVLYLNDK